MKKALLALPVVAILGIGFALIRDARAANPDTQTLNVTASITASFSFSINGTADCGTIDSISDTSCTDNPGYATTSATLTSVGYDNFSIDAGLTTVNLTNGADTITVQIVAYESTQTSQISSGALDSSGTTTIYFGTTDITNLDANDSAGTYSGSESVTISAT